MITTDPGKQLIAGKQPTKPQATAARMTAWAKPTKAIDRDKLRAERIADYEAIHGKMPERAVKAQAKGGQK